MTARTPEEAFTIAEARVVSAGTALARDEPVNVAELLEAAQMWHAAARRMQACLRWASNMVIDKGGIPRSEMQVILSAAGRGEDFELVRKRLLAKRQEQVRGR